MVKYSRQRECILNNLKNRSDHPTADMVYESVRMEQPNISLGTVYRNLSLLAENGQILKITTKAGPDRFDGCMEPHTHFICNQCGNVLDLWDVPKMNVIEMTDPQFDGIIEGYELQIFGKCGECLQ
ncbi:MAG: transcriptional repressor [bacterium]|nr:transcriptional repressor [bacterium]